MVKQLNAWKENNMEEYKRLFGEIAGLVKELVQEWKAGNREGILGLLRKNEDYLRELGEKSGVNIETEDLKKLSEAANSKGAAGKLSGAGGGDCGIAVSFSRDVSQAVRNAWEESGIHIVDAAFSFEGVKKE